MSRIGKKPVAVPGGVTAAVNGQEVKVKGPKGELKHVLVDAIIAKLDNGGIEIAMREEYGLQIFEPKRIEVKRGEQIRFVLRNEGENDHEFMLATTKENLAHAEVMRKHPNMEHDDPNGKRLKPKGKSEILWRFTKVGEWNGVRIVDDYGHHPVEIAAVLRAARESADGNVIAVMQPHRYTRLHDLFEQFCTCFNDADAVVVAPVYPAGEAPIPGIDRDTLVAGLRAHGHKQAVALEGPEQLAGVVKQLAAPGDYVICLGAGSITQWAYALPDELKALG